MAVSKIRLNWFGWTYHILRKLVAIWMIEWGFGKKVYCLCCFNIVHSLQCIRDSVPDTHCEYWQLRSTKSYCITTKLAALPGIFKMYKNQVLLQKSLAILKKLKFSSTNWKFLQKIQAEFQDVLENSSSNLELKFDLSFSFSLVSFK